MVNGGKSKKVLIVDDDEHILEALKIAVESDGHKVMGLLDGTDTYKVATNFLPDVIFLDFLMAGKDGATIAKELKQNDETKNIPIVMISAHPDAQEAAIQSGANYFLAKPFEYHDLLGIIDKS